MEALTKRDEGIMESFISRFLSRVFKMELNKHSSQNPPHLYKGAEPGPGKEGQENPMTAQSTSKNERVIRALKMAFLRVIRSVKFPLIFSGT